MNLQHRVTPSRSRRRRRWSHRHRQEQQHRKKNLDRIVTEGTKGKNLAIFLKIFWSKQSSDTSRTKGKPRCRLSTIKTTKTTETTKRRRPWDFHIRSGFSRPTEITDLRTPSPGGLEIQKIQVVLKEVLENDQLIVADNVILFLQGAGLFFR